MKQQVRYKIWGLVAAIMILLAIKATALDNPKEWISFWQKEYTGLKPSDDPRAKKANEIFSRLNSVAGSRPGVILKLYITKTEPLNERLPISLPDGSIILSRGNLDICYRDPARGDDRLAFVLAHEIAHQLNNDFWHVKFFYAIEKYSNKGTINLKEILGVIGEGEEDPKRLQSKELMADCQGIIYASMAGFNSSAIVMEDERVNFFEEWIKAVDPTYLKRISTDSSHPSPKQRAVTVKARLRQVLDNVEVFNLGVLFYQAGDYQKAILAFNEFLKFFPSREVYHNIASCYHQLALKYYQAWKGDEKAVPFKLSIAIDPTTRASRIALRGGTGNEPADQFKEHIEKAIELYQKAIALDPSYYLSYNNLGCALIVKGETYKAVGMFQDALKIKPDYAETLNNLGVAYFYAENLAKAKESLAKAQGLDPTYSAPLFNLAKIAQEEKNSADAKKYGEAYLKLDPAGPWADLVRASLSLPGGRQPTPSTAEKGAEKALGLEIGAYDDKVPKEWGKPVTKERRLEEKPFRINTYSNRVMTLSQDDEIKLIVTLDGFAGKSVKGIALGSSEKDVISAYGAPAQVLAMTQGVTWLYVTQGIAFRLRNGKVVAWLLF